MIPYSNQQPYEFNQFKQRPFPYSEMQQQPPQPPDYFMPPYQGGGGMNQDHLLFISRLMDTKKTCRLYSRPKR